MSEAADIKTIEDRAREMLAELAEAVRNGHADGQGWIDLIHGADSPLPGWLGVMVARGWARIDLRLATGREEADRSLPQGWWVRLTPKGLFEAGAKDLIGPELVAGLDYVNWRGERSLRKVIPCGELVMEANEWHKDLQWIMPAIDLDKNAERGFAMRDIRAFMPWSQVEEMQASETPVQGGEIVKDQTA